MNRIDLGQTIGILANLDVIAGIVFLAIEIQQNTESLTESRNLDFAQAEHALSSIENVRWAGSARSQHVHSLNVLDRSGARGSLGGAGSHERTVLRRFLK
jgi:hypothetical protein